MHDASVFLAIPSYDQAIAQLALTTIRCTENARHKIVPCIGHSSVLTANFNRLWVMALNSRREHKLTHFVMQHSDIEPEPWWIDKLVALQRETGADILSCVVPIKDQHGLTSTGCKDAVDDYNVRRFTLKEIFKIPETFNADTACPGKVLMINTGLWICDFTKPWVEEVCFTMLDCIRKKTIEDLIRDGLKTEEVRATEERIATDPTFEALCISEDWHFSSWAHQRGLKVFATRAVKLKHWGRSYFSNEGPWGLWETDEPAIVPARPEPLT